MVFFVEGTCSRLGLMIDYKAKSRKYQGVFKVKSQVKTWQVRGIWSHNWSTSIKYKIILHGILMEFLQ